MIRISNHGPLPLSAWKRVTVNEQPPFNAGRFSDGTMFRVGRRVGLSTWVVDVKCQGLASGPEGKTWSFEGSTEIKEPLDGPPSNPEEFFGKPMINGIPMQFERASVDGSAWMLQIHGRVGELFHVRVWGLWRPDEPSIMQCECVITASNGSSVVLMEAASAEGLVLQWGTGIVHIPGRGFTTSLVSPFEIFADGVARGFPLQVIWPEHIGTGFDYLFGHLSGLVSGHGATKLFPQGNPIYAGGFDEKSWVGARFMESIRRLHTFEPPVCGPNIRSADAGEQEDQIFVRGECLLPNGQGGEIVAYHSALKLLNRPCHHLERNGLFADEKNHPNCMFWGGRPHFATPDHLGKLQALNVEADTHGWSGPDDEHWLYNTLFAAARLTGSYALQWEMEQQAHLFLFQETLPSQPGKAGWFTTNARSARSVGWACLLAVYLVENLENRILAYRVSERIVARIREVYVPTLGPRPVWDPRLDAPSLGAGWRWMPWQQAVGAYGLHIACTYFGLLEGVSIALDAAKKVMSDAIVTQWGRFVTLEVQTVQGDLSTGQDVFWWFGFPLAIATILYYEPDNLRARAIWDQMTKETSAGKRTSWMDPTIWGRYPPAP